MNNNYRDMTLALAGVFQAGCLVNDLAMTGNCDQAAFKTCVRSLFIIDAPDVPSIYSNRDSSKDNLRPGLLHLKKVFDSKSDKGAPEITRYALSLIHLERRLMRDQSMQKRLRRGIDMAHKKLTYFGDVQDNIITYFAGLYKDTFGALPFKIHIIGKQSLLQRSDLVDCCRALLLAGIRSAVLWQQVGGRRWQLLFMRRKYVSAAKELL